jgi:hypothetical protein
LCAFADGKNRCFVGTLEDDIEEVDEEDPRTSRRDRDDGDEDDDEEDDEGQILLAISSIASAGVWAVELSPQSGVILFICDSNYSVPLLCCFATGWRLQLSSFFLFESIMIFSEAAM